MSKVNNALSFQKQFSPQPQDTHVQRLAQVASNISVSPSYNDTAAQLAQSLGVLSKTAVDFGEDREKRWKETAGIAAKRMIEGKTVVDLENLKSLEMVQNYTDYDLTDNPYAVSALETLRGKTLSAKVKADYETYKAQNGYSNVLRPEDEAARYDKFMADSFGNLLSKTPDTEAFKRGFYDNHTVNQMEQIEAFNKHRSTEYKALRKADTNIEIANLVRDAMNLDAKAISDRAGLIFRHTRLTGADTLERKEYSKELAASLAKHGVNPEVLQEVFTDVTVGVDADGKDISLEKAIGDDLVSILDTASIRQAQLQDKEVQEAEKSLYAAGSLDKANQIFADWKVNRPQFYMTMSGLRGQVVDFYQKAEKKALVSGVRADEDKIIKDAIGLSLNANYAAYYQGSMNVDANGNPVGGTLSTLKGIKYRHINDDMTWGQKERSIKDDDVMPWARNQALFIAQDAQGDENKYYYNMMKLASYPPVKVWSDTLTHTFSTAMANLNVEQLSIGEGGQAEYPRPIKDALRMYQANPADFYNTFGKNLTDDVERILTLTKGSGDDLSAGVKAFASSRDKLADPYIKKSAEAKVWAKLDTVSTLQNFTDMDGEKVKLNRSLSSNAALESRVKDMMIANVAQGMNVDTAFSLAVEKANQTHWVYRDTAIPKAIFGGIPGDDKAVLAKRVMDDYVKLVTDRAYAFEKDAWVTFDEKRNVLEIHVGNDYQTLTANDIQWAAGEIIRKTKEEADKKGMTNYTWQQYLNDHSPTKVLQREGMKAVATAAMAGLSVVSDVSNMTIPHELPYDNPYER